MHLVGHKHARADPDNPQNHKKCAFVVTSNEYMLTQHTAKEFAVLVTVGSEEYRTTFKTYTGSIVDWCVRHASPRLMVSQHSQE